jgi:membrane-associated phospholipid phosphatase
VSVDRCAWTSVLLLAVFLVGAGEGVAQPRAGSSPRPGQSGFCTQQQNAGSLDLRGLALVYCTVPTGVSLGLEAAHLSARPVFYGAVPAAWAGAAVTQEPHLRAAAYRLTLTQGVTYGLVVGTKHLVGRPRPYVHRSVRARAARHQPPAPGDAYLSFPSGHAALSAALVTSWGASYPRWYVLGPGALWATAVALSRVHLGVHYPSDILAGTIVGAGVALLVHQLRETITPAPIRGASGASLGGPPLVLRLTF